MNNTDKRQKLLTLLAYALHALGPSTGHPPVIIAGLIINIILLKKGSFPWRNHHRWMIITSIFALSGWALSLWGQKYHLGWLIMLVTLIWWSYRLLRGILLLSENHPPQERPDWWPEKFSSRP